MSRRGGGGGQASCAALPGACFSLLCAPRCDDGSALALASLLVMLAAVLTAGWTGLVVGALRTQAQRECVPHRTGPAARRAPPRRLLSLAMAWRLGVRSGAPLANPARSRSARDARAHALSLRRRV